MTDQENDRADLEEARRALVAAETASVETDAAIAKLSAVGSEIRRTLQPNGYVTRFRAVLRGT
jgi:hypothetical protein